jgi:hypothetical protein
MIAQLLTSAITFNTRALRPATEVSRCEGEARARLQTK